jgi:hypothetical protein
MLLPRSRARAQGKGEIPVAAFFVLRDFEEQHEALRNAAYEDPLWVSEFKPRIVAMLDRPRMVVTRLDATPRSGLR